MSTVFFVVYNAWGLSELLLNRMKRLQLKDKQGLDRNSLGIIWLTVLVAVFSGIMVAKYSDFRIQNAEWLSYLGLVIIVSGIILRLIVIRSLGEFFTVGVTIREKHALKTDGFFRLVRHPSYAASLLSFAGYGISLNNWASLLIVFTLVFMAFSWRIYVEEKALTEEFGEAYANYKSRTKRLIPFIY